LGLGEKNCVSNGNAIQLQWLSTFVRRAKKNNEFSGGKRGGNLNSQIPAPQENVWLRSILRDENFFVGHAKLTIFEVSPTLSNLTKLGSMCIPSHYAALFAATGNFPSVDGKNTLRLKLQHI
jgi:hypothetical protein